MRAFPDATVLPVHHTGKDMSRGERGNTALRGAADTVMRLSASKGVLSLSCVKQKDWEPFKTIKLALRQVTLDGGETSCVIGRWSVAALCAEEVGESNDGQVLDALRGFGETGASFTEWQMAVASCLFGLPVSCSINFFDLSYCDR